MKSLIAAAFASAMLLAGASASQAMPIAPAAPEGGLLTLVAQGCGPGFHRAPRGFCVRNGFGPVVVAPRPRPVIVAPVRPPVVVRPGRVCPRGFFLTQRGVCRPIR
ncbi:GCG_CRPN prefix-to-repeats domain-containing protein [Terrarubrum flagellatum]|uniref:GCG_CRPN prefix-to-repeats domain-containing protein n=1 Tax=Terrirubrum flagellatum TaxID=2895980 RepID=UPI003144DC07